MNIPFSVLKEQITSHEYTDIQKNHFLYEKLQQCLSIFQEITLHALIHQFAMVINDHFPAPTDPIPRKSALVPHKWAMIPP